VRQISYPLQIVQVWVVIKCQEVDFWGKIMKNGLTKTALAAKQTNVLGNWLDFWVNKNEVQAYRTHFICYRQTGRLNLDTINMCMFFLDAICYLPTRFTHRGIIIYLIPGKYLEILENQIIFYQE
jgi:hypothetical protein